MEIATVMVLLVNSYLLFDQSDYQVDEYVPQTALL